VAAHGGQGIIWKTGHSLIKAKMKELKSPLAGEMSGHIFFADTYYGYDDGPYAALRLLSALSHAKMTLKDFADSLPPVFNTPEMRIDCPEERKFSAVADIVARAKASGQKVVDIGGSSGRPTRRPPSSRAQKASTKPHWITWSAHSAPSLPRSACRWMHRPRIESENFNQPERRAIRLIENSKSCDVFSCSACL
jgi:phosphomannomutase